MSVVLLLLLLPVSFGSVNNHYESITNDPFWDDTQNLYNQTFRDNTEMAVVVPFDPTQLSCEFQSIATSMSWSMATYNKRRNQWHPNSLPLELTVSFDDIKPDFLFYNMQAVQRLPPPLYVLTLQWMEEQSRLYNVKFRVLNETTALEQANIIFRQTVVGEGEDTGIVNENNKKIAGSASGPWWPGFFIVTFHIPLLRRNDLFVWKHEWGHVFPILKHSFDDESGTGTVLPQKGWEDRGSSTSMSYKREDVPYIPLSDAPLESGLKALLYGPSDTVAGANHYWMVYNPALDQAVARVITDSWGYNTFHVDCASARSAYVTVNSGSRDVSIIPNSLNTQSILRWAPNSKIHELHATRNCSRTQTVLVGSWYTNTIRVKAHKKSIIDTTKTFNVTLYLYKKKGMIVLVGGANQQVVEIHGFCKSSNLAILQETKNMEVLPKPETQPYVVILVGGLLQVRLWDLTFQDAKTVIETTKTDFSYEKPDIVKVFKHVPLGIFRDPVFYLLVLFSVVGCGVLVWAVVTISCRGGARSDAGAGVAGVGVSLEVGVGVGVDTDSGSDSGTEM